MEADSNAPATKADVERVLGAVRGLNTHIDTRLDGFDTRLDRFDTRLDGFDTRLDGFDKRLDRFDTRLDGFDKRLDGFDKRLDENLETIRNIETNLLTAFHNYARGQQARMHQTEANDRDMLLRLQSLEERMLDLESRFPKRIT
jgi:archaellum component FlaC